MCGQWGVLVLDVNFCLLPGQAKPNCLVLRFLADWNPWGL